MSSGLIEILSRAPVIPVVTIERLEEAVPLARALVRGGLPVLEITLRTAAAVHAIEAMQKVEGAIVGAGTVLNAQQASQAASAGARFLVSPGLTQRVARAARKAGLPWLPGVATAGETMAALELGFDCLKFFPAHALGGPAGLRALAGPFPHVRFCPTGGITLDSAPRYLELSNVVCVGGAWVAPREAIEAREWTRIERLAASAAALRHG